MKLVTYNIHYGVGRDGRFDAGRIADAVRGADIIALQEVSRNLPLNGGANLVAELGARLNDFFHVFGAGMDVDFGARDALGKRANKRLQFGNMVLSRWPILACRNLLLPRTSRSRRANFQRSALEALVDAPDGPLRTYSVHLDHVDVEERLDQIRFLRARVLGYPAEGGAITGAAEFGFPELPAAESFVVMGDFNMERGSPEHRLMVVDGIIDAFDLEPSLPADAASYVSGEEPGRNRLIDYAFLEVGLADRVSNVWIDAPSEGSDHLPLWLELAPAGGE